MISSRDPLNKPSEMIKVDADIILVIYHLKSKLQLTVDCRHVYGHQDGKNRKEQEERDEEREEEKDDVDYAMESESSVSEAEEGAIEIFNCVVPNNPRGTRRKHVITKNSRGRRRKRVIQRNLMEKRRQTKRNKRRGQEEKVGGQGNDEYCM